MPDRVVLDVIKMGLDTDHPFATAGHLDHDFRRFANDAAKLLPGCLRTVRSANTRYDVRASIA